MEELNEAIRSCPIIDNHAHNLLLPSDIGSQSLLSCVSEAHGGALRYATSTLAHMRAVKQLAEVLGCEPSWDIVQKKISEKRVSSRDAWNRRCFEGISTVLIDDGLDRNTVHSYDWHDSLTTHPCNRIVRIEVIAQEVLMSSREDRIRGTRVISRFLDAIKSALEDPKVAGFKSVICYRVGLDVGEYYEPDYQDLEHFISEANPLELKRLAHPVWSRLFVHLTARMIAKSAIPKPFQFHTGLGDNDITLTSASAAMLQPFVRMYPGVPVVLLHASYPFTAEAAYLASVYENCYLDIGEVFPMISQDGQERVLRTALETCPTEKLMWSTDGHWFPESYLLAVIQIREALEKVLGEYVVARALTFSQAVKVTHDLLYETANRTYHLNLPKLDGPAIDHSPESLGGPLATMKTFMKENRDIKFIELQYLDYTATLRSRVLPAERALRLLEEKSYIGLQQGVLRQLQNDGMAPNTNVQGKYTLYPCLESLRLSPKLNYATIMCEIRDKDALQLEHDPRTVLESMINRAKTKGLSFMVGFEIEVVFMKRVKPALLEPAFIGHGHNWSNAKPLEVHEVVELIDDITSTFRRLGIELEQFHTEAASSQFEIITGRQHPMAAVDALVAAKAAIRTVAYSRGLHATFVPKIGAYEIGTGAHCHLSFEPEENYEFFYAGVLKHMASVCAFTLSNKFSYERLKDGCWAGGRYICWGTENREAPLRKIENSHWELKAMDGLANGYLALGALMAAGLLGMERLEALEQMDCTNDPAVLSEVQRRALGITKKLPATLPEALKSLAEDREFTDFFGKAVVKNYTEVKQAEMDLQHKEPGHEKARLWLMDRY